MSEFFAVWVSAGDSMHTAIRHEGWQICTTDIYINRPPSQAKMTADASPNVNGRYEDADSLLINHYRLLRSFVCPAPITT